MGSFARVVDFTGWSGSVPRRETISFVWCNDHRARTRLPANHRVCPGSRGVCDTVL